MLFQSHKGTFMPSVSITSSAHVIGMHVSSLLLFFLPMQYAIDFSKLKSLGWEPQAQFDNELGNTVNWYINNEEWWKNSYQNIINSKRKKRKGLV